MSVIHRELIVGGGGAVTIRAHRADGSFGCRVVVYGTGSSLFEVQSAGRFSFEIIAGASASWTTVVYEIVEPQ